MPTDDRPTVYSTERGGDLRKKGSGKKRKPNLPLSPSRPPEKQTIYLHRESKGRGGKVVSLVQGLQLSEKDLKALAKQIKQACGSGGTIKDGIIEIQGEHRPRIAILLESMGYRVKIAGG